VWTAPGWQELCSRVQQWSEQPCVRPVCAVHVTAGHNALRGSGPGQYHAFDNALARVGCPDRRIDRLCITCCLPSQPFTSRRMPPAVLNRDVLTLGIARFLQALPKSAKRIGEHLRRLGVEKADHRHRRLLRARRERPRCRRRLKPCAAAWLEIDLARAPYPHPWPIPWGAWTDTPPYFLDYVCQNYLALKIPRGHNLLVSNPSPRSQGQTQRHRKPLSTQLFAYHVS
jgi:hypothetical protein